MLELWIEKLDLQLLAEGDSGAGEGTGADVQGDTAPVNPKRAKRNPLADVPIGIQPGEATQGQSPAVQEQEQQPPAQEETFDDLIKGKYKADYDAKVQQIVKDRLKNAKEAEAKLQTLAPALMAWGQKLGIQVDDVLSMDAAAFAKAVMDDDAMYAQEAEERGIPVDVLKQVRQLEMEKAHREQMDAKNREEAAMQAHFQRLVTQAEQAKQLYPGFDLMSEMNNPDFVRLTSPEVGVDVRTAYEVVHNRELQASTMAYAVNRSQEKLTNAIAAQSARPMENGAGVPSQAVNPYADPRNLTKEMRAEIRRRVSIGDKTITF